MASIADRIPAVIVRQVTTGRVLDDQGNYRVPTSVVITDPTRRTWAATGDKVVPVAMPLTLDSTGSGSLELPVTDQDGWINGATTVKDWTYTVTWTYSSGPPDTATFLLPASDTPLDLDSLVTVPTTDGKTVGVSIVSSIDGMTGDLSSAVFGGASGGYGVYEDPFNPGLYLPGGGTSNQTRIQVGGTFPVRGPEPGIRFWVAELDSNDSPPDSESDDGDFLVWPYTVTP